MDEIKLNDDDVNVIACAIIRQALKDLKICKYKLANNPENEVWQDRRRELFDFFQSHWFEQLTGDNEYIMNEIRKEF